MDTGMGTYRTVCTILIDDVPTILFLVNTDREEYEDSDEEHYVLDIDAYRQYIKYLVDMVIDKCTAHIEELTHEDIPNLEELGGTRMLYGKAYICKRGVSGYVENTEGLGVLQ